MNLIFSCGAFGLINALTIENAFGRYHVGVSKKLSKLSKEIRLGGFTDAISLLRQRCQHSAPHICMDLAGFDRAVWARLAERIRFNLATSVAICMLTLVSCHPEMTPKLFARSLQFFIFNLKTHLPTSIRLIPHSGLSSTVACPSEQARIVLRLAIAEDPFLASFGP
jgi:hypothetical protein